MGEFNDGRAFAYQNTGESVMIFDKTIKIAGDVEPRGYITTLGLTSLNQSLNSVSAIADPLPINVINQPKKPIPSESHNGHTAQNYLVDTVVVSGDVSDESYESAAVVHSAGSVVAGTTFDTSFVTWHMDPVINKKATKTNSWSAEKFIRMRNHYSNVGDVRKIHPYVSLDSYPSAIVYTLDDQYLIKNGSALVDDNQLVAMGSGSNILEPLTASVEDYKPPTWGSTGSGSGVKSMMVIAQKFSYNQIYMAFDDTKITEVQGLPQGMTYDNQFIKGTPLTSGVYNVKIKMDNTRTLEMTLQIPELPRQI